MALYNGILKEGALFQGDAAKAAGELSGKMSATGASTKQLQATIGEGLAPAVASLLDMIKPVIDGLGQWIKANPEMARGLGLATFGAIAAGAAVAGLTAAVMGLWGALGPIGWAILGVGALAGAFVGLTLSEQATARQQQQVNSETTGLMRQYEALRRVIDDSTASTDDKKRATQQLKDVVSKLGDIQPQMKGWFDEEGRLLDTATGKWAAYKDAVLNAEKAKARIDIADSQKEVGGLETDRAGKADEIRNKFRADVAYPPGMTVMGMRANLSAPSPELIDALAAMADPVLQEKITLETGEIDNKLALAKAKKAKAEAYLAALDAPMDTKTALGPPTTTGSGTGTGTGSKEMTAGLKADLEGLQDLQAGEHSPEKLKAVLAMTREIIATHYDELAKLDKLRDMQRTAQITLPNEIAQAEYNQALSLLDADKQLKNLNPEAFAQGLRGIKDKFAAYLAAHPDQALQMDLRLKGASDEELRAPLEAQREAMRRVESAGGFDGTGGQDIKRLFLKRGLSLAIGANDQQSVAEFSGQIKQIEKALSDANFTEKFDGIKKAREAAFVGAAGALAELQKQLTTEEAKGDKTDPARVAAIKQQVLDVAMPALVADKSALEALRASVMADTTISEEERAKRVEQIEQSLNGVRQDLYAQDVDAHRIATEAKTVTEKAAADERKKIEKKLADDRKETQKDALQELDKAEKKALEEFKKGAKAREDALQDEIKLKEQQLKQYDRQLAAEDRLKKITDAKKRIADLEKSGEREQVLTGVDAQGKPVYETRIKGMDEAKQALADAERDDERARHKEQLQDQIQNLRDQLQAEKDSNRDKEQALHDHFAAVKEAMQKSFEEMNAEQATGLDNMKTALVGQVDALLGEWARYAAEAKRIIESIPTAPDPPAAGAPTTLPSSPSSGGSGGAAAPIDHYTRGGHTAFGTGGFVNRPQVAVVGDRPETIVPDDYLGRLARMLGPMIAPTIPADIARAAGGMGAGAQTFQATLQVNVTVPPGTPQHMQQAAYQSAHAGAQAALDAARRGMNERRIGGTKP